MAFIDRTHQNITRVGVSYIIHTQVIIKMVLCFTMMPYIVTHTKKTKEEET